MSSERYSGPPGHDRGPATVLQTEPTSRSDFGHKSGVVGDWTALKKTALFAGDLFAGEPYDRD